MPDNYEHIAALIVKGLRGKLSRPERTALGEWLSLSEENRQLFESFMDEEQFLLMLRGFAGMDQEADWITLTNSIPELRYLPDAKQSR